MKASLCEVLTSFLQKIISHFVCLLCIAVVERAPRCTVGALSLSHLEISSQGNIWSDRLLFVLSYDAFDFLLNRAEVLLSIVFMTATICQGNGCDRLCLVIAERSCVKALVEL